MLRIVCLDIRELGETYTSNVALALCEIEVTELCGSLVQACVGLYDREISKFVRV